MTTARLSTSIGRQRLKCLLSAQVLGADKSKVEILYEQFSEQERFNLQAVQDILFPDHKPEKRGDQTRAFRARLVKSAGKAKISIELAVDDLTKLPAADRQCWLAGEQEATDVIGDRMIKPNADYDSARFIPPTAISNSPPLAITFPEEIEQFFSLNAHKSWFSLSNDARMLLKGMGSKLEPFVQLKPHVDTRSTTGFECLAYGPGGLPFGKLSALVKELNIPEDMFRLGLLLAGAHTAETLVKRWLADGLVDANKKMFTLNVDPILLASPLLKIALDSLGEPPCRLLLEVHESCVLAEARHFLNLKADYSWLELALDDGNDVVDDVRKILTGKLVLAKVDYKTTRKLIEARGDDTNGTLEGLAAFRQKGIPLVVEGVEDMDMLRFLNNRWKNVQHGPLWIQGWCVKPSVGWLGQLLPVEAGPDQPCGYLVPSKPIQNEINFATNSANQEKGKPLECGPSKADVSLAVFNSQQSKDYDIEQTLVFSSILEDLKITLS